MKKRKQIKWDDWCKIARISAYADHPLWGSARAAWLEGVTPEQWRDRHRRAEAKRKMKSKETLQIESEVNEILRQRRS